MKQETKHSMYFRVLVFVFKQLLRDCSGGQASPGVGGYSDISMHT